MSAVDFPTYRGPGDPEEDVIYAVLERTFWCRFHELLSRLTEYSPSRSREQAAMWMLDTRQQIIQALSHTGDTI